MTAVSQSNTAKLEEPSSQPDASMEEILASIRRIIAEEQSDLSANKPDVSGGNPSEQPSPVEPSTAAGNDPEREFDDWLAETATGGGNAPDPAPVEAQPDPATDSKPEPRPVASFNPPPAEIPRRLPHVSTHGPDTGPMAAGKVDVEDDPQPEARQAPHVRSAMEIPRDAIDLLNSAASVQDPAPAIELDNPPAESDQAPPVHITPADKSEPQIEQAASKPNPLEGWPEEELTASPKLQVVVETPADIDDAEIAQPQVTGDDVDRNADPLDLPIHSDAAEPLLSEMAGVEISSSFQTLSQSVLEQNNAMIEAAIKEMLRPMLKQWLDDNLPPLVERLVRAEIERVARGN